MKKLLLITILGLLSLSSHAQFRSFHRKSIMPKASYETDFNRFGLGADFRFMLANSFRVATDATFYFPKDKATGIDAGVNIHYLTTMLPDQFIFYPMIGCVVATTHIKEKRITSQTVIPSSTSTNVGFAVGVGGEFNIGTFNENNYLSLELKYIFSKDSFAAASVGYGFRF